MYLEKIYLFVKLLELSSLNLTMYVTTINTKSIISFPLLHKNFRITKSAYLNRPTSEYTFLYKNESVALL